MLRGGKTVAESLPVSELDAARLAELMVGESTAVSQRRSRDTDVGSPVLAVEHLIVRDLHGRAIVDDVSLTVASGEIVGIAGVAGNGQRPLSDAIAGLIATESGKVMISGANVSAASPRARNNAGLAYVPEDRLGVGLAPRMDVVENSIMRAYRVLTKGLLIDRSGAGRYGDKLVEDYNVKVGKMDAPIAGLSGGNLQRLLVGRELEVDPVVLVAAQPTRGLDVKGVAAIQQILVRQAAAGVGILLISEDLEELFALSDRLLVMHEGEVVGEFDPDVATRQEVGAAMAGAHAVAEE